MKVAITGYTSGIGKSLSSVFENTIGFSRTNGFDLRYLEQRVRMYNSLEDCDVFINNADLGWEQTKLLYELWERWKDKERIIVNIGSDAADYNQTVSRPYSIQKRALQDASLQLQQSGNACKVILIKPGYVDTPRVRHIPANSKIDPDELAKFIKETVEHKSTFWVPIVTIYPRTQ